MKKIVALVLALAMMASCVALADEVIVLANEGTATTNSFVEAWAGTWTLESAYIGAEFAEENGIEQSGVVALADGATATLTLTADLDASATGSSAGVMVDQAAYYHAHVYDVDGTLVYGEEEIDVKCPWDGWTYTVPSEGACDYSGAIGKLSKKVTGEAFSALTGIENEAITDEKMVYIGMTEDGKMVLAYADANLCKKGNDEEIGYALIFAPAVAE